MDPHARKLSLKTELLYKLRAELAAAEAAHAAAVEGATHAEARPESDKDTRGLEQSYLARGQARRALELAAAVATVEAFAPRRFAAGARVALGALVTVEADEEDAGAQTLFVAPFGGGQKLERGEVLVITPESPMGAALLGKQVDDEVEIVLGGGPGRPPRKREVTVVAIV